jgi:Flp pilus assembly protein TadD
MPLHTAQSANPTIGPARSAASIVSTPSTDGVSRIQPGSHEAMLLLAQARNAAFEQAAQGRLGEGVNLLCNALEIEPTSVDLMSDVAALLLSAGQLADAALYAHQAIQIQPQHAPSLYTLAFALSGLGEVKAAIEVLTTLCQGEAAEMLKRETPELAPLVATELRRLQMT